MSELAFVVVDATKEYLMLERNDSSRWRYKLKPWENIELDLMQNRKKQGWSTLAIAFFIQRTEKILKLDGMGY